MPVLTSTRSGPVGETGRLVAVGEGGVFRVDMAGGGRGSYRGVVDMNSLYTRVMTDSKNNGRICWGCAVDGDACVHLYSIRRKKPTPGRIL